MAKLNSGTRIYGNTAIDTFLTVSGAVASNSTTTGTIIVTGGIGVSGNVYANAVFGTLTSATGLPISTGVSGLGTGVATALAVNTGSAGAVVLFNGALGTPSSGTLTNATGLPVSGITASTSTALGVGTIELGNASDTTLSRSSAGVLAVEGVVVPTVSSTSTLTNKTLTFPIIDNIKMGYTTTATAAGTTTLTSASNRYQRFTGTTTQTIVLPVTSTLATGVSYEIENTSTGNLTVNSSGGNLVITVIPGVSVQCMCIGTALTTAADWDAEYNEFATITGTGAVVLNTSPVLTTPNIGTPSFATLTNATSLPIVGGTTGTLTIARGGTNQTSYTTGAMLQFNGTSIASLANSSYTLTGGLAAANTITSLTVDSYGRVTAATGEAIAIAASQITSGTLGVTRGGTGVGSFTANSVLLSGATSTSAVVSLNSSTEGHVLQVSSAGVPVFGFLNGGSF
jgi:hypothetical protein